VSDPPRDAALPPGYDESDPYADEDLSKYPDWWRRNIEEFRAYEMRPYRPPRLADGTVSPPLVDDLQTRYGVTIQFRCVGQETDEWHLFVDGEAIRRVHHERDGGGYTIYGIESDELRTAVREAASRSD
jgi:hypothetical protein